MTLVNNVGCEVHTLGILSVLICSDYVRDLWKTNCKASLFVEKFGENSFVQIGGLSWN
jgi:hypothetical protein